METKSHRVVLVVDPEFGMKVIALSQRVHVWLIESPTNTTCARQATESRQGEYSTLTGITTFASEPNETGEDAAIRILETIDEHHDEYGSNGPWASIELLGTPLTKRLRLALEEYGVTDFVEAAEGFVAHRAGA